MGDPTDLLKALLDNSTEAVVYLNPQGRVELWNPTATALFGWTEAETKGKHPPHEMGLQIASEPGTALALVCARDGRVVDLELRTTRLAEGGWLLVASDRTRAVKAAQDASLRLKMESRFRELLEAAPDAIIEVDREGRIVLLNAATEEIFGYGREELLGRPVETLIPAAEHARHVEHRAAYRELPVTRPMGFGRVLRAVRKDGSEFPVEISLSPVGSAEGFRVTAIIRDITQKQRAEAELRTANQKLELQNRELERASRLKSEFLASMSHELRTPLHTIIGFTELLAEELEGPLNDKQKRFLNHVYQDSQHLLALINDILDLSKIEAGRFELHPEPFDAATVIADAVNAIRPMADAKRIAIEVLVEGIAPVHADRLRFREILNNLLSNAVKFTPEGGSVQVARHPSTEGMACFSVADSGIGIAPEDHAAVFDKFRQVGSTTRGVREGTGLGLAIVKSLVEMHGGTISLDSAPGVGSRFTFTVPGGDSGPPMVLVIEDEPSARELFVGYLEPLGIRTECAASADEGIRMARDLKPDAITLDLLLPGKSGWRVLRELRSVPDTSLTPIFVVSVLDRSQRALEGGATEYLEKPLKKDALLRALHRHAPGRFPMIPDGDSGRVTTAVNDLK